MALTKPLVFSSLLVATVCLPLTLSTKAHADDYSDLLDILRAKGSLTQREYNTLLSKHIHRTSPPNTTTRN